MSTAGRRVAIEPLQRPGHARAALVEEAAERTQLLAEVHELLERLVDGIREQVQRHVVRGRQQLAVDERAARHAGVDTQRCPYAAPRIGNCSGMWSSWCHSLYSRCAAGSVISVKEKKPTLTLFTPRDPTEQPRHAH